MSIVEYVLVVVSVFLIFLRLTSIANAIVLLARVIEREGESSRRAAARRGER